jgi:hypothetical protein
LGQELKKVPFTMPDNAFAPARHLEISPNGKMLAVYFDWVDRDSGTAGARLALLDVDSGKELATLPAAPALASGRGDVIGLTFSPDSRWIALAAADAGVLVAQASTGKEHRRLDTASGAVTAMAFSPDGRCLAVALGGVAPRVQLWELATGRLRASYSTSGHVNCLAFSPDGLTLASAGADLTIILWDVGGVSGRKLEVLSSADLNAAWEAFAKLDGQPAFSAQRRLIASPAETVAFLKTTLRPAQATHVDEKNVTQLVADLDSETFEVRDRANRTLEKQGRLAEPALRQRRAGNISLEMRRRIDDLLDKLDHGIPSAQELQTIRAVEVLERIGTTEARQLLEVLAGGAPGAVPTIEAQHALRRMKQ